MASNLEQAVKHLLANYKNKLAESKKQVYGYVEREESSFKEGGDYTLESVIEDLEKIIEPSNNEVKNHAK